MNEWMKREKKVKRAAPIFFVLSIVCLLACLPGQTNKQSSKTKKNNLTLCVRNKQADIKNNWFIQLKFQLNWIECCVYGSHKQQTHNIQFDSFHHFLKFISTSSKQPQFIDCSCCLYIELSHSFFSAKKKYRCFRHNNHE